MSVERTSYNIVNAQGFVVVNRDNQPAAMRVLWVLNESGTTDEGFPYTLEMVFHATAK